MMNFELDFRDSYGKLYLTAIKGLRALDNLGYVGSVVICRYNIKRSQNLALT